MAKAAKAEKLSLKGPAGELEALLETPDGELQGAALVCHPHPAHGGAMTNKVTHTIARAMNLAGFAALRFNFRGVGASEGAYDEGIGERADAFAAAEWLQAKFDDAPIILSGFSFGSGMALHTSASVATRGLVLVAPPVGRILDPETRVADGLRTLVVQGGKDEIVDADAVVDWVNEQATGIRLSMLEEAGHFFHGDLIVLRDLLVDELAHF
ncbi:MAG: alpha/beta fold hydrolase [Pseudomonadota bacterium]